MARVLLRGVDSVALEGRAVDGANGARATLACTTTLPKLPASSGKASLSVSASAGRAPPRARACSKRDFCVQIRKQ